MPETAQLHKNKKGRFYMNKILVTSIKHDFINTSSKKILLEIPANNSLFVEIIKSEGDDNIETKIYAVLRD